MDTDPGGEYHLELLNSILLLDVTANFFELAASLFLLVLLLVCSALISGSEVAYFSLDQNDLDQLEKEDRTEGRILKLLEKPKHLLATILVANNFINVAIILVSNYLIKQIFDNVDISPILHTFLTVVLVTFLLVLFGEVAPKVYAKSNNLKLAKVMAGPLLFLRKIIMPIGGTLLIKSTSIIETRLNQKETRVSFEEIDQAIELTVKDDKNANQEIELLKSIVKFGNVPVKQIMCARVDIKALEIKNTFKELLKMVRESGYSRIPVYEENFDSVIGFLYAKDLLKHLNEPHDFDWHHLIRKNPFFIPENKKIDDLLKEFQDKRVHVAIVVDEYGGTSGLITLEDVLEEIIGEIQDEFDDHEEVEYKKINDFNFLFEGKTMINDVCRLVGVESTTFDDVRGDSDSVAGLILEKVGKLPQLDSVIPIKNYKFKIVAVDKRRIRQIKVTLPQRIGNLKQ